VKLIEDLFGENKSEENTPSKVNPSKPGKFLENMKKSRDKKLNEDLGKEILDELGDVSMELMDTLAADLQHKSGLSLLEDALDVHLEEFDIYADI